MHELLIARVEALIASDMVDGEDLVELHTTRGYLIALSEYEVVPTKKDYLDIARQIDTLEELLC